MKKNILVFGGSYFVGRIFVEDLIREGVYSVYVVNRGNRPIKIEGIHEIVCNRNHPEHLRASLPPLVWDAVVDFCAYSPVDIEQSMSALPQAALPHYIFISTASIYEPTLDFPIKEDAPKLRGLQTEMGNYADYGYNKWLTELKLAELCQAANIPHTSLRPTFIYGPYNYAPRESYFFDLIMQGRTVVLPDNGLALFQFVSVWDVAKIIRSCIGNEKVFNRAFNLAAEELICYRRLVEILQKVSEKRIRTRILSVDAINQLQIPLPFPLDDHLIYSGRLIQQVLGFHYIPFPEGLKLTYEHYLKMIN
ncbi:MAG: NAD-dependent epimerase/dehydratase family protein [Desulfomonilaceae bacterium]